MKKSTYIEPKEQMRQEAKLRKWTAAKPARNSLLERHLKASELIMRAYYHSPASRLRLENIALRAELGTLTTTKSRPAKRVVGFAGTK